MVNCRSVFSCRHLALSTCDRASTVAMGCFWKEPGAGKPHAGHVKCESRMADLSGLSVVIGRREKSKKLQK
jgi:hypothetical protein